MTKVHSFGFAAGLASGLAAGYYFANHRKPNFRRMVEQQSKRGLRELQSLADKGKAVVARQQEAVHDAVIDALEAGKKSYLRKAC